MHLDEDGFVVPTSGPGQQQRRRGGGAALRRLCGRGGARPSCPYARRLLYRRLLCGCRDRRQMAGGAGHLNPDKIDKSWGGGGSTGGGAGGSAKYQHYETKDGKYLLFCGIEAKFWKSWCHAAERENLLSEHRDDLVVDFSARSGELRHQIQKTFQTKTAAEWMQIAVDHDIAIGPRSSSSTIPSSASC
jgi:hypothetical protein